MDNSSPNSDLISEMETIALQLAAAGKDYQADIIREGYRRLLEYQDIIYDISVHLDKAVNMELGKKIHDGYESDDEDDDDDDEDYIFDDDDESY